MSKVTDFKTLSGGKSETSRAIDELKSGLTDMLEYMSVRAELKRNYYDHLLKQGFSKEDALKLVAEDGMF